MYSLHDEYMQRGETIYVGQPDSVKIFPGKNRVKITYRNYDPKVGKLTIYWDFRDGSASFDVPANKLGEEVEMIVEGLKEKQYTFELVTTNPVGLYSSIPLYITGQVYGTNYVATLSNRKISKASIFPSNNNRIEIVWTNVIDNMVCVELLYHNTLNEETILLVDNNQMETIITDSKDENIRYRTLHLPENCIDMFYTNYVPINLLTL